MSSFLYNLCIVKEIRGISNQKYSRRFSDTLLVTEAKVIFVICFEPVESIISLRERSDDDCADNCVFIISYSIQLNLVVGFNFISVYVNSDSHFLHPTSIHCQRG